MKQAVNRGISRGMCSKVGDKKPEPRSTRELADAAAARKGGIAGDRSSSRQDEFSFHPYFLAHNLNGKFTREDEHVLEWPKEYSGSLLPSFLLSVRGCNSARSGQKLSRCAGFGEGDEESV
ncbi:MAG TPA: hypothetical protein VMD99_14930 [Terriglobales bacterium]|nr:hypothetical protein [Terriglobales bacterium]